jgi:hypothetical protein
MGTVTSTQTDPTGLKITTKAAVTFVWDLASGSYIPRVGTLDATRDFVGGGCTSHATYHGTLGGMDGHLLVNSGTYSGEGTKMADYVGTSMCGATPEAVTLSEDIKWWPSAIEIFFVKPNGDLQDSFDEVNPDSGQEIKAEWLFVRVPG